MAKKISMSEQVRRYMAKHPSATARQVAESLGVKISLVYAIKYSKKKEGVNIDAVHRTLAAAPVVVPTPTPVPDVVNHPPHYKAGGIETIDFLQAKLTHDEFVGYLKGNVLKYGSRLGKKGEPNVDAGKMAWYAVKLREVLNTAA